MAQSTDPTRTVPNVDATGVAVPDDAPTDEPTDDRPPDEERTTEAATTEHSLEDHVEQIVAAQLSDVEGDVEALESELDEIRRFAEISLGERRLTLNEENLAEFSASLTEFSEKTLDRLNELESRLEMQTIVLAAVLEALADDGADVDLSELERYREGQLVTDASAAERFEKALESTDA